jgi:hypothetical protein
MGIRKYEVYFFSKQKKIHNKGYERNKTENKNKTENVHFTEA